MKMNKDLVKNLARSADFINTVNGGSIYPTFKTSKEEDHYRVVVSVPTVNPEAIKVEVSRNNLMVFQQMEVNEVQLPNLLGLMKISEDVILDEISAEYEDDLLVIILPFSEMSGGFRKEINILRH